MCWDPVVVVAAARAAGMKVRPVGRGDWLDGGRGDCLASPWSLAPRSSFIQQIHRKHLCALGSVMRATDEKPWPFPGDPSVLFSWNSTLVVACPAWILSHLPLSLEQEGFSGS